MVRYIIQRDCHGDAGRTEAASADREYLGRDGAHVLRDATSYALADFALRYGFVSLHLAEALVQHIQSMDRIAHQDSVAGHASSYNVIPVFMS